MALTLTNNKSACFTFQSLSSNWPIFVLDSITCTMLAGLAVGDLGAVPTAIGTTLATGGNFCDIYGTTFADVLTRFRTPPERTVAFTMAVIGLSAKMAKADGLVTRNEVTAFREIFYIPPAEEANAARVFNLARQDIGGFESYASTIARMFENDPTALQNLLQSLFVIATADGVYHPAEDAFLRRVSEIFGFDERVFRCIRSRAVHGEEPDPYTILGVEPGDDMETIRSAWRRQVRECHPDRLMAHGVPEEAVKLATRQLATINRAWEDILLERAA